MTETPEYSSDARIEAVMGNREIAKNTVIFLAPVEHGFACPVHGLESEEELGDTLHWSEYNSFLWCETCNKDYPSALCATGNSYHHRDESTVDAQIRVYLDTVETAVARATAELQRRLDAVQLICEKATQMGTLSVDPNIDPRSYETGFAHAAAGLRDDLHQALSSEKPQL